MRFTTLQLMIVIALLAFAPLALTGCGGINSQLFPSTSYEDLTAKYCDGEDSFILEKLGDPLRADSLLRASNCAMLQYDVYSYQEAEKVLDGFEAYLDATDGPLTGADVYTFAVNAISGLKEDASAKGATPLLILSDMAPAINVPTLLTPCDRKLLRLHIERQRSILELCAPAE
jgi:hypothetical protein